MRLTPLARSVGLVHDDQWNSFLNKKEALQKCLRVLQETYHTPHEWRAMGVCMNPSQCLYSICFGALAITKCRYSSLFIIICLPPHHLPQLPCSFDGTKRSAANMLGAQYVSLKQLMLSMPGLKQELQVTCRVTHHAPPAALAPSLLRHRLLPSRVVLLTRRCLPPLRTNVCTPTT